MIDLHLLMGKIYLPDKHYEQSLDYLQKALKIYSKVNSDEYTLQVCNYYFNL